MFTDVAKWSLEYSMIDIDSAIRILEGYEKEIDDEDYAMVINLLMGVKERLEDELQ